MLEIPYILGGLIRQHGKSQKPRVSHLSQPKLHECKKTPPFTLKARGSKTQLYNRVP